MTNISIHNFSYENSILNSGKLYRTISLISYLALFFVCAYLSASADDRYFNVRGVAGLSPEIAIELARNSEPIWEPVSNETGMTLREVIRGVCGESLDQVNNFLIEQALRLNRVSSPDVLIKSGVAIAVPFCLKVDNNTAVTVGKGDTAEAILKREYGLYGPKTVKTLYNANSTLHKNIGQQEFFASLKPGDKLILPYSAPVRTFVLRPDVSVTPLVMLEEAKQNSLVKALKASVKTRESAPDREPYQFAYVQSITLESARATAHCIQEGLPVDDGISMNSVVYLNILKSRFEAEVKKYKNQTGKMPLPSVVGIIDTGIDHFGDEFFQENLFSPNLSELNGIDNRDDDLPENTFVDDIYGINFNNRSGNIDYYATDEAADHGTKMASIIIGSPALNKNWSSEIMPSPIILKVVNFSSSLPQNGTVEAINLADAIAYLNQQGASIVNLSLSNKNNLLPISNAITNAGKILFVVAAGNARKGPGVDLRAKLIFPARYGGRIGDHRRQVLTVGAHNIKGTRAEFSNHSSEFVDILGPGCSVRTRGIGGMLADEHGTSPATAIGSFAAGIIEALGEKIPSNVKNRILSGSDYDERLKDEVWSSGRINVIKAISLRHDVIDLGKGPASYIFGKIKLKGDLSKYCRDPQIKEVLENVTKIIPNLREHGRTEVEYWFARDGIISKVRCDQINDNESIGPVDVDGITSEGASLKEITDVVLSHF